MVEGRSRRDHDIGSVRENEKETHMLTKSDLRLAHLCITFSCSRNKALFSRYIYGRSVMGRQSLGVHDIGVRRVATKWNRGIFTRNYALEE